MFDIKPYKSFKNLHIIVDNRHVFYNDGENDILYTGTNELGNRILGSIVAQDDENDFLRYFHTLVSDIQFNNFIERKISLRGILKDNDSFFSVDMDYLYKEKDYNIVFFNDIPDEYLPLESSVCPQFITSPILK